jgi:hypothetical protein
MNYNDAFNSPSTNTPISQYTRGYSTNNIYAGVPPLMSDGRAVMAAYQPESIQNDILVKESGVKSNWEYRQYLTNNAVKLMGRNFEESANDIGFIDQRNAGFVQRPIFQNDSDLKQLYLSREDLATRFEPRVLTQEEMMGM